MDGVITSFAIVAGTHAGEMTMDTLWVIGISSLVADGLSMGVSEYLSSTTASAKGEQLQNANDASPLSLGLACFVSFVVCGIVPTVLYAVTSGRLLAILLGAPGDSSATAYRVVLFQPWTEAVFGSQDPSSFFGTKIGAER